MVQLKLVFVLLLALSALPAQAQTFTHPQTVALALENHRFEIITIDQAREEYDALVKLPARTPEQEKRYAALVWTLGTVPTAESVRCPENHAPRCETLRGRRLPLQRPN